MRYVVVALLWLLMVVPALPAQDQTWVEVANTVGAVIAEEKTVVDDNLNKDDPRKQTREPKVQQAGAEREEGAGMLTRRFDAKTLKAAFLPKDQWRPFPPASDREAWNSLSADPFKDAKIKAIIASADSCLETPWPELPATLYMQFAREGNRNNYETPYFARRRQLGTLVLAECFTGQGKYLDAIADGLWMILEETTWCLPAHAGRLENDPLPRLDRESVDLFACETAAILAEVKYLLEPELQALSPTLADRVSQEVLRRVVIPVEERGNFHWISGPRNNWTPWCSSNVLCAAMHTFDDNERLASLTLKLMTAVEKWIGVYGDDGGCDEGPNYWGVAAGSLLMFLDHLHSRTEGKVSIYDEQKVKAMGEYIATVQLAGPWFVNFADGSARLHPSPPVVYRYGERVGSDSMKALAVDSLFRFAPADQQAAKPSRTQRYELPRQLREFWWIPAGVRPEERPKKTATWLPDLQILVARQDARQDKGLALAAKGGHNRESHNHNDVGHFTVMLDGQPRIVDVGVETYSRKTFSPERYDIWCIRGNSHNAPVVNEYEQVAGSEHRATNVDFADDGVKCKLAMNLEEIFPKEAGVKSLRREIILDRAGSSISVTDNLESNQTPATATVTLYACPPVDVVDDGSITIGPGSRRLILNAGPTVDARVEAVLIEDTKLRSTWGKELIKITLDYIFDSGAGSYKMDFKASE